MIITTMNEMNRRNFIRYSAMGSAGMAMAGSGLANLRTQLPSGFSDIKPISGSWFEFQHLLPAEGEYWDNDLAKFTEEQWKEKVREISELGFEYLVIQEVALNGKSIYPSKLVSQYKLGWSASGMYLVPKTPVVRCVSFVTKISFTRFSKTFVLYSSRTKSRNNGKALAI